MARCFACSRFSPRGGPRFRQLLLGASQDGQLCILPPPAPLVDPPLDTPFITKIPDELLDKIFTHALKSELWTTGFYHTALALSTVSKDFHRIVQPLMYRTIHLSNHSLARPCLAVKQFHRTIKGNLALGSMVKILRVHVEYLLTNASEFEFMIGIELLGLLPNVESFDLHGGYEHPSTWPMIRNAVGNWPRIKHVGLSREDWSLLMPPVCELVMAIPSLNTLNLYGVSTPAPRNSTSHAVWTPPSKVSTFYFESCLVDDELNLNQDIERTSNIISLIINDFGEKPEALQNLLKLPRALEHFTFGKIHSNPVRWRLDMFQWLLADHQTTLRNIEIGSLGLGYTPINFLEFPNLEILNLSHWVYKETPEVAAASILAPRLHTFIWDFRIIDQHSESWTDFGEEQKKWLLRFAELAIARKSALRKIKIMFYPDEFDGPRTREELAICVTPWDLMDEVKDKIKPLGIELEYNQCWTREECLQRLEWEEKLRKEDQKVGKNEDEISFLDSDEEELSRLEES
jgi:hypothetical protein